MEPGSARIAVPFDEKELRALSAALSDVIRMLEVEFGVTQDDVQYVMSLLEKVNLSLLEVRKINQRSIPRYG